VKPGLQKIRFHSKNSKDVDASASFIRKKTTALGILGASGALGARGLGTLGILGASGVLGACGLGTLGILGATGVLGARGLGSLGILGASGVFWRPRPWYPCPLVPMLTIFDLLVRVKS
jgi:hypothetical protein